MNGMFITTADLQRNYASLGIVTHYHAGQYTKQIFGSELKADDLVQKIIEKLKEKAAALGADGIIGLRIDTTAEPGMMAANQNYNVYGTAVKFLD